MDRVELARRLAGHVSESIPAGSGDGPVIIEERDPVRFMSAFAQAVSSDRLVFLADPAWGPNERAIFADITSRRAPPAEVPPSGTKAGWLMIPSGGTSGRLKFARHDERTIAAAVQGFCTHFRVERVNSLGVLPLHHVSGLMAWMRSALTGGTYLPGDWKRIEAGDFPAIPHPGWFVSMVPTQLQRLLSRPHTADWLRGFDAVFVGGGPVWPELAEAASRARLPLSLGYGMTETAAMVTASRPGEFLAGDRTSGTVLEHARIDLTKDGLVRISGESVFRGYFPGWSGERSFVTEDLGEIDPYGRLAILGRRDAVIITGGKKVDPSEVEAALRGTGAFADLVVIGVPDSEWGQAVVVCYPETQPPPDMARVTSALTALASYKRPRRFVAIADWPRNSQGKLNRSALLRILG